MRSTALILSLVLPAVLCACGGGGGGDSGDERDFVWENVALRVNHTPSRTGTVFSNTDVIVGAGNMAIGDTAGNVGARVFFSFPLTALVDLEDIVSITLQDAQTSRLGSPFSTLGTIAALDADIGPSLTADDYDGPLIAVSLGTFSTSDAIGERSLDLTSWTLSLLDAGADRLDFMLQFDDESDDDGNADMVWLRNVDHPSGPGFLVVIVRRKVYIEDPPP